MVNSQHVFGKPTLKGSASTLLPTCPVCIQLFLTFCIRKCLVGCQVLVYPGGMCIKCADTESPQYDDTCGDSVHKELGCTKCNIRGAFWHNGCANHSCETVSKKGENVHKESQEEKRCIFRLKKFKFGKCVDIGNLISINIGDSNISPIIQ